MLSICNSTKRSPYPSNILRSHPTSNQAMWDYHHHMHLSAHNHHNYEVTYPKTVRILPSSTMYGLKSKVKDRERDRIHPGIEQLLWALHNLIGPQTITLNYPEWFEALCLLDDHRPHCSQMAQECTPAVTSVQFQLSSGQHSKFYTQQPHFLHNLST